MPKPLRFTLRRLFFDVRRQEWVWAGMWTGMIWKHAIGKVLNEVVRKDIAWQIIKEEVKDE